MKEITFIHAADLHLDSPFTGLKNIPEHILLQIREAAFLAFQKIVNEAIYRKVNFILLAGDLYDGENRNLRTQVRFRREMEKLQQKNIEVYIIHGNHDHLDGNWINIQQPTNVHVFTSECGVKQYSKTDVSVHIYGYSYPSKHVKNRIIENYKKKEGATYHIGMLHGNLEGQNEHGQYAPFSIDELISKQFDYWALGHIHKRQELHVSPPIIYPGNIQGRHKKELGEKGCYYVKLAGKQSDMKFIPTSEIIWEQITIKLNDEDSFDTLLNKCQSALQQLKNNAQRFLVQIQIDSSSQSLHFDEYQKDLLELLQEEEEYETNFVYPYSITLLRQVHASTGNNPLLKMIQQYDWSNQDVVEAIQPLYKHSLGRKFLPMLSSEEKEELIREAMQLLDFQLSNGGEE